MISAFMALRIRGMWDCIHWALVTSSTDKHGAVPMKHSGFIILTRYVVASLLIDRYATIDIRML